MRLDLVTAPVVEPLTTAEAKLHCRVDVELTLEDVSFGDLVTSAREYAEGFTRRALITQSWQLKLDCFPRSGCPIELPLPPLQAVSAVTYLDEAGATQTWPAASYTVDAPRGPRCQRGRIIPKYLELYPPTQRVQGAVTVAFTVGYGSAGAAVPAQIRRAMLLQIAELYDNRGEATRGTIVAKNVVASERLLWPYRSFGAAG